MYEFTIEKKNNVYSKSLFWHLIAKSEFGKISLWYKTKKEAIKKMNNFNNTKHNNYVTNSDFR